MLTMRSSLERHFMLRTINPSEVHRGRGREHERGNQIGCKFKWHQTTLGTIHRLAPDIIFLYCDNHMQELNPLQIVFKSGQIGISVLPQLTVVRSYIGIDYDRGRFVVGSILPAVLPSYAFLDQAAIGVHRQLTLYFVQWRVC